MVGGLVFISVKSILVSNMVVCCYVNELDFAVSCCKRGISAHSSCAQHQRRWEAEDHVCPHFHQGYWSQIRQYRLQESRCRHEQKVIFFSSLHVLNFIWNSDLGFS